MASRLHYPRCERRYSVTCRSAFRNCLSATTPSRAHRSVTLRSEVARCPGPVPRGSLLNRLRQGSAARPWAAIAVIIETTVRRHVAARLLCVDMSQRWPSAQRHFQVRLLGARLREQASLSDSYLALKLAG